MKLAKFVAIPLGLLLSATLLVAAPTSASAAESCNVKKGTYQKQVERLLGRKADGKASRADCLAVKAYQKNNGMRNPNGHAGHLTYTVLKRQANARSRANLCKTYNKVVCVDLTNQMMWISKNGKRTWGPYAILSGRNGFETRHTTNRGGDCRSKYSRGSADYCKVFRRHKNHYNSLGQHMPYSMFFDSGEAIHTYDRYIYSKTTVGSHGCIQMLPNKAEFLWKELGYGTKIYTFGTRPGT